MIKVDGSYGEGGGQILRSCLTLSSITGKSFHLSHIRSNRKNPGLQPQHLLACQAVHAICQGTLHHAELSSQEIIFEPDQIRSGNYFFDIQTAGSTILVLQTLLPILVFASSSSHIKIRGGTHVLKSPSYDYFEQVFLPAVARFGVSAQVTLHRSGYFPKGGGEVALSLTPTSLIGNSQWDTDDLAHAIIRLGDLPSHIAKREEHILREALFQEVKIFEEATLSQGNAITAWQGFRGAYVLGKRGKRAEKVTQEVIDELFKEKAPIDFHLADQILLYAALAKGESEYQTSRLSSHFHTHAYVISHFLNRKIDFHEQTVKIS